MQQNDRHISPSNILALVASGMAGGFLAGLLGIGGSPVYVFIFTMLIPGIYGLPPNDPEVIKLAVANTIFARLFAALSGSYKHYRLNNFYPKTFATIGLPASAVAVVSLMLLDKVNYSKTEFSVVFILLFLPLLYKMLSDNPNKKIFSHPYHIKVVLLNFTGFLSGLVSALAGFGGGFVVIPMLNSMFNIKIRKVISISLGVILISSFLITLYNLFFAQVSAKLPYSMGTISFALSLPVIAGVLLAAPLGVVVSKRLTPLTLRMIFIAFCLVMILRTCYDLSFGG